MQIHGETKRLPFPARTRAVPLPTTTQARGMLLNAIDCRSRIDPQLS
jgi:hypothetical protein